MPKEQITNFKYVKPVSDVWSMAATFYHMLTGCTPFNFPPGKDPIIVVLQQKPTPIKQRLAGIPAQLAQVIDNALLDRPEQRYPDAGALLEAIEKT